MKLNFLYSFFWFVIFLSIVSCSNKKLVEMGVVKKKSDQFSVSRNAPLEMPPDMYLRPPKSEKKENYSNPSSDNEQISLDDILISQKVSEENKDKDKLREKRILKKY